MRQVMLGLAPLVLVAAAPANCPDPNGDGVVDVQDLVAVITGCSDGRVLHVRGLPHGHAGGVFCPGVTCDEVDCSAFDLPVPATDFPMTAEQIFFDDAGNVLPGQPLVFRVYVKFDDPAHQLVGVFSSPERPFVISAWNVRLADSEPAADRPPSFGTLGQPGFEHLSADTWFTIGATSIDIGPDWPSGAPFEDMIEIAPGTSLAGLDGSSLFEPDGAFGWSLPPMGVDPGSGLRVKTPQSVAGNWPDDEMAVLQIRVDIVDQDEQNLNYPDLFRMRMGLLVVLGDGVVVERYGGTGICFAD